jgi:hypothetical protein
MVRYNLNTGTETVCRLLFAILLYEVGLDKIPVSGYV